VGIGGAIGFGVYALLARSGATTLDATTSRVPSAAGYRCPPGDLGTVAFLRASALGRKRLIFKLEPPALAPAWLQGFSPDDRWLLFWEDSQNSASLAADGLPLVALPLNGGKPVHIANELNHQDFLAWCNAALVYVIDRGGREVTLGDGIAVARPPLWRSRTVLPMGGKTSWNAVACPTTAAAARRGGGRPDVVGSGEPAAAALALEGIGW
jgi:hypothetical protein